MKLSITGTVLKVEIGKLKVGMLCNSVSALKTVSGIPYRNGAVNASAVSAALPFL